MQKWAYMTWVVGYPSTLEGTINTWKGGVVKYKNGEIVEDWKNGPKLTEALNQVGEEGWELVEITRGSQEKAFAEKDPLFIFKRPKS